ncbi:MAG: hypothetical protein VYB34_14005, partial [Planctomycetota bacterium]|nr:hypothetical protein [Planctomycetota bacterium]
HLAAGKLLRRLVLGATSVTGNLEHLVSPVFSIKPRLAGGLEIFNCLLSRQILSRAGLVLFHASVKVSIC